MNQTFSPLIGSTRNSLVKLYHSIPGVRNSIGLPSGFYASFIDWIQQIQTDDNTTVNCQEIYSRHKIFRSQPKTIESTIHKNFAISNVNYSFESASVSLIEAKTTDGFKLWGPNGAVITPDNKLVVDSPGEFYVDPTQGYDHSVFLQWRLPPLSEIKGKVAVLSAPGSHSYFHWMLNTLPRFHLLEAGGVDLNSIDRFILSKNCHTKFHLETLNALNISQEKIILADWQFHAKVEHLVIPHGLCLPAEPTSEDVLRYKKYGSFTGNVPRWACDFVRKLFLPSTAFASPTPKSRKIYITRKTSIRKVLNEPEVIEFLTEHGFETVDLAEFSIAEQAKLLNSASAVVAVHGAGLTNVVFCREGTKVIEIFPQDYVKLTYWGLCNILNLDYYYAIGEVEQSVDESDDYAARQQNLLIPIKKLSELLNKADYFLKGNIPSKP
ncbi:DUF563 domain-containing protein [Myxosarcina sp. GI1]|uniref:glycosyltransferase family 61 protein n=1 Tax=Myxosarcina sp. GI1 TaxID=1541065 RepID=UPI00055B7553|nr:glycosyltransferase family 61 protein [Myxosarcina sp. GI1]